MSRRAKPRFQTRGFTLFALLIPASAGLAYLGLFGAPLTYVAVNAGALVIALAWIAFGQQPSDKLTSRSVAVGLMVVLALPLIFGPEVDGVARWISMGGLNLHTGMVVIPLLVGICAQDTLLGPYLILAALLISFAQPDSASTFALSLAALGIWAAKRDGRSAIVAALGMFASIGASFNGNLAPQDFVEGILASAWIGSPGLAIILCLSLLVSLGLILFAPEAAKETRYSLAGALAGFTLAAMAGNYPFPLIGYGAASIIGFGLALSALGKQP